MHIVDFMHIVDMLIAPIKPENKQKTSEDQNKK
jgi:hypothetical protein